MTRETHDPIAYLDMAWRKKGVRFAVSNPTGGHSGIWTIFARDSGVYFGARSLLGAIKISLHRSGRCRVAFTEEYAKTLIEREILPPEKDRAFLKWTRPPTPQRGISLVASVIFPGAFLGLGPQSGSMGKPLVIFEIEGGEMAAEFGIFYTREKSDAAEEAFLKIGKPICYWTFDDGESAHLVARAREFNRLWLPSSDQFDRAAQYWVSPERDPSKLRNLNAVFFNEPGDNRPLQTVEVGRLSLVPRQSRQTS